MPKFIAMWNLPGCLPEMEPADFCTFDEAKRFIIDELKEQEDQTESESFAEIYCHEAERVNLNSRPFCVQPVAGGYVYSVAETDWDYVEARIGSHFLSYLINGDASGIEDSEARALDNYIAQIQEGREGGHWSDGETEEFARCAITGLMGECVNVRYNFKERA
jgi:hypothetical protein